ncbi:MAG: YtxH domain-containing protein [Alloprevotella tannerae]|nr:YtxH domain-containing protein [Alloprevotella tannerae]
MKAISIFAALLSGAAIGAAAGLLMAPEEGKETRRRLKAKGSRIADKVNETLRNKGIKLSREDMEDMVDDIADELKPIDD